MKSKVFKMVLTVLLLTGSVLIPLSGASSIQRGPAHCPQQPNLPHGSEQSPIHLTGKVKPVLNSIQFKYNTVNADIVNDGHTIQVNVPQGNSVTINGVQYKLAQFHFHTPSEHKLQNRLYDMEVHFVHQDSTGKLAVVGAFIQAGSSSGAYGPIFDQLPQQVNQPVPLDNPLPLSSLLPKSSGYYSYCGSLTTGTYAEGVRWLVLKKPITLTAEDIEKFRALHHDNNRAVQPLNHRTLFQGHF
ncbi:carbonic anhydrase [Paenibacillus sp. 481]|uniref:carbonic anhydrase n=1 Tax=Paenibacillus sp. 481 TaxID=2835869 RepID=UPI001E3D5B5C|nr:carbonic anhydrase family protein [Paenibacillus sp. 481]UHA74204.1 carbonic anhydrase family protein [Paenibacillus sp. 481]